MILDQNKHILYYLPFHTQQNKFQAFLVWNILTWKGWIFCDQKVSPALLNYVSPLPFYFIAKSFNAFIKVVTQSDVFSLVNIHFYFHLVLLILPISRDSKLM